MLRQEAIVSLTSSQGCSRLGCINESMDGLRPHLSFFHFGCPTLERHVSDSSNFWRPMAKFVDCNSNPSVKSLSPLPCPSFTSHVCFDYKMTWTRFENGMVLWPSFFSKQVLLRKGLYILTSSSRSFRLFSKVSSKWSFFFHTKWRKYARIH